MRIEKSKIIEIFQVLASKEVLRKEEINLPYRNYLVSENILFYNSMEGIVRPQSKLIHRAIKDLI